MCPLHIKMQIQTCALFHNNGCGRTKARLIGSKFSMKQEARKKKTLLGKIWLVSVFRAQNQWVLNKTLVCVQILICQQELDSTVFPSKGIEKDWIAQCGDALQEVFFPLYTGANNGGSVRLWSRARLCWWQWDIYRPSQECCNPIFKVHLFFFLHGLFSAASFTVLIKSFICQDQSAAPIEHHKTETADYKCGWHFASTYNAITQKNKQVNHVFTCLFF